MLGLYSIENTALGIRFPTTHFLYLHGPRLSKLVTKHRLSCRAARRLPARLRPLLAPLGLGRGVYLKPYLRYFDTMNLVMATALAEGCKWRILQPHQKTCIHIGGSSGQQLLAENPLATYIGLRLLQRCGDPELRRKYAGLYSAPDPETWLSNREARHAAQTRLVLAAEEMLARLDQRLAELR